MKSFLAPLVALMASMVKFCFGAVWAGCMIFFLKGAGPISKGIGQVMGYGL